MPESYRDVEMFWGGVVVHWVGVDGIGEDDDDDGDDDDCEL